MANFVNYPIGDLGAGIDALSAESKIPEGFSESLVNVEPTPEGYLRKRTGYSSASGYVPFRVTSVTGTASDDKLCFNIDSGLDVTKVDLSKVRSSPIVVSGYVLQQEGGVAPSGDFSSQETIYYTGFSPDIRFSFVPGSNSHTITGTTHGLGDRLFVGAARSDSSVDSSNSPFIPGEALITIAGDDVTVEYTNGGATFDGFIYLMAGAAVSGEVYNDTGLFSSWAGSGPISLTIPAATHGLNNSNIIPVLYEGDGNIWRELAFADYSIANDGQVVVSLDIPPSLPNYLVLLKAAPAANALSITVPANSSVVLGTPVTGDYVVYSVYETSATERVRVIPDGVVLSVPNSLGSFSLTNSGAAPKLFTVYFDYASIITNRVCVTSSTNISADYSSDAVQLTLWGISHADAYSGDELHAGWVTHVDNYRTEIGEQLVAGLGGVLFSPGDSGSMGSAYPRLRNRITSTAVIGPAFSNSSLRTRGYISYVGAGEGYSRASDIVWQSGNSVAYTLVTPSRSVFGSPISTASGVEDWLTVSQASNPVNNGLFKILSASYPDANTTIITVSNSLRDSADYDEQDCGAQVGIFTDQLPVTDSEYVRGDRILADGLSEAEPLIVLGGSSSIVVVQDVYSSATLSAVLRITGQRTSSIVPLRTLADLPTSTGFLVGDVVSYSELARLPQVVSVFPYAEVGLSITVSSGVATCTMGSNSTDVLSAGQRLLLVQGGDLSGEHILSDIVSTTVFTFDTDAPSGSYSAVLAGHHIVLNETLEWADTPNSTTSVSVPSRWVPIESPRDNFNLTPKSVTAYFDSSAYVNQPALRSVMSGDNMYFTNGNDEVYKFDGVHNYRAGLPRWQPQLFTSVDTTATAKIVVNLPTIPAGQVDAVSGSGTLGPNVWKVNLGQETKFVSGQPIIIKDNSNSIATEVLSTYRDATHGYIKTNYVGVIPSFTANQTTIILDAKYRYYFRLSARDIHDNIIATAATGADDYIVSITEDAAVRFRLVGLPAIGNYDYDNIKLEIYRTKLATTAPFYQIATLSIPFNKADGYIDYVDTESDDTLTQLDILSNFTGANLGTGLSEPIRSKYITSIDNRLVLANVKDYAKLTITFQDVGNTVENDYNTQRVLFRKDSSDTGTTTDNLNRMAYEWRNTGATPVTAVSDQGSGIYRITTTASLGLVTGNWMYLYRNATSAGADLLFSGWHQVVNAPAANQYDIQLSSAGYVWSGTTSANTCLTATNKNDIPITLSDDYNYNTINGNKVTSTNINLLAIKKLADAINATQRVCQTVGFSPWMTAAGGAEFGSTLVVSSPSAVDTFLEVVLPTPAIAGVDFYVNNIKQAPAAAVAAVVQIFSSRVVVSYDRLPEIFDRPTGAETSSSVVFDVNPADGQSITGCIPFFGDSAFGAANTSGVLVVFKTNSIYLLDVSGNSINNSRIQKIDSRGIGCTAPFSIAPTQNGIMFASGSGIYRVTRSLTVEYVGRKLERLWQTGSRDADLADAAGHYYAVGNQYKLSLPTTSDSGTFVYNTVREYQADGYRTGSWTTYTNTPAVVWCNNSDSAFFASTSGDVFYVEKTTDEKPYRDQGQAIPAEATMRSLDFGDASIRKEVRTIMVDYRTSSDPSSTVLSTSTNNNSVFQEADLAIVRNKDTENDGLGSTGEVKIRTIRYSPPRDKGVYFQIRLSNDELDNSMEVAGVTLRVAGMTQKGTTEAKSTQS